MGLPDDELMRLATVFRDAIERCDLVALGVTFESFPRGSCGDAALLLARFLSEHGAGATDYMLGERGEGEAWSSHAWLRLGEMTIDIAADQFEDQPERVIVSRDSVWHDGFVGEAQHAADYRLYDAYTVSNLDRAYALILSRI